MRAEDQMTCNDLVGFSDTPSTFSCDTHVASTRYRESAFSVPVPLTDPVLDGVLVGLKCQAPASQSTVVLLQVIQPFQGSMVCLYIVKTRPRRWYTRNV